MDFNLGTARGKLEIDASDAERGAQRGEKAVKGFTSGMEQASSTLMRTGAVLGGIGAAAVGGFALAVNSAANFEQRISAVGAVTNASGKELDQFRKLALQLGADTKFSAGEAAVAIEELGKAGIPIPDIMSGAAKAVTDLAAAGEVDLKRATEITANAMNAFGIAGKDAAHIADVFASAANSSAADVSELGLSLSQVSAVAATVGLSFEDTIAALALFADKGLKGSDAGTSLKTTLLNLQPTTEKQKDLFKSLGLFTDETAGKLTNMGGKVLETSVLFDRLANANDKMQKQFANGGVVIDKASRTFKDTAGNSLTLEQAMERLSTKSGISTSAWQSLGLEVSRGGNAFFNAQGKLKPLIEIQAELQKATAGMTQQQKLATLEQIGGSDAVRALAIITDTSREKMEEYGKTLGREGAASETAKKRMDNLKGSMEQLSGSVETAMISIGRLGTGPIRTVVDWLTKMVNGFIGLSDTTKQWIIVGVLALGVLTGLAGGFLLTAGFVIKMVKTFQELQAALKVVKSLQLMTKAMHALNASFLTNPVFLIIAGIVALGVALFVAYKKSEAFRDFVDGLWQGIQKAFDAIVDAGTKVVNFFKGHWNQILIVMAPFIGLPVLIIRHWGSIVNFFQQLPGRVVGALSSLAGAAAQVLVSVITTVVGFVAQMAVQGVQLGVRFVGAAIQALMNLPTQLITIFGYAIGFTIGFIIRMVAMAIELGTKFVVGVIEFLINLPDQMAAIFLTVITSVASWVVDMVGKAIELGTQFLSAVVEFFQQLPERIWDFLSEAFINASIWVNDMAGKAVDAGSRFLNAVVDFFQQLPGRIGEFLGNTLQNVLTWAGNFIEEARRAGREFLEKIRDGIFNLPDVVGGIIGRVIDAFLSVIKRGFNAAKDFAKGLWDGFRAGIGLGSPSYIDYAIWSIRDNVINSVDQIKDQMDRVRTIMKTSIGNRMAADLARVKRMMAEQGLDSAVVDKALVARNITLTGVMPPVATTSVTKQDVFHNTFQTQASAEEIAFEIMWQKRVR